MMTESPRWLKSSYSDNGGNCVEVAADFASAHGVVPVRDSKVVDGPVIAVPGTAFAAFVTGVRGGTFDTV
ncbi:DUF397 domain-containing protein [Streptomyces sp. DH7]|uniref:DUF397 domain-containing protein n=1 Tax=unclassified Streptomyces TaxID=2593676 RepID=UPI001E476177|nr:DUF397 domain-containing protein [Streptomyces sp. DH7]